MIPATRLRAAVRTSSLLALALVACHGAPRIDYPESPRGAVIDDYHGTAVPDPYRWLEDSDSPETRAWIESQNELTQAQLEAIPERDAIRARLEALWTYERFGVPTRHGDWYYYSYNDGRMSQSQVVRSRTLTGEFEVVLDPAGFSEDGTVSLGGTSFSRAGRYLAYGQSDGGSDWRTWRVRDLETGENLVQDVIEWSRFSSPTWAPDDTGFYYGRYPETADRLTAEAGLQSIWYHRLGTSQSEDSLIYEDPEHPDRMQGLALTDDGRFLMLFGREGTAPRNRLHFMDLEAAPDAPWIPVFDDFDAQYTPLGNEGWTFWIETDKDAPLGRIVKVDCSQPGNPLESVVPEDKNVLASASLIGGRIYANYLADARSRVLVFEQDGTPVGPLTLPGLGSASGFGGRQQDTETFFSFSSYATPPSIYRVDVASEEVTLVRRAAVPFDAEAYEVHQFFYPSRDGTRIPIFLTHKRGLVLDGTHPTLLTGYGGFNISLRPGFSTQAASWLEMGGVYAVACLRGGGEYGREWHEAGILQRKQTVFDDFIAAAEWLSIAGYTRPSKLAILGGSNGGLLVGATLNQRPDLFGAALPAVGVMDMLRYHTFTIGKAWASDYGRSDDPEMFTSLRAYSPVHNAVPGTHYPATMITTGDHDDRVVPAHSFKYAAAVQFAQAGSAPILIRIETRAGHGAGKSREQALQEVADRWAFLVQHLEMEFGDV